MNKLTHTEKQYEDIRFNKHFSKEEIQLLDKFFTGPNLWNLDISFAKIIYFAIAKHMYKCKSIYVPGVYTIDKTLEKADLFWQRDVRRIMSGMKKIIESDFQQLSKDKLVDRALELFKKNFFNFWY